MKTLTDLIEMMARLRAPDGCPWDREQTFATLAPMLIEEAFEMIEAAEAENWDEMRDELGDVLFQLVFYGQIAAEAHHFTLHDAITRVYEKMWRRHPHVFGDEKAESTAEVLVNWEAIKAAERKAAGKEETTHQSLLDGVSKRIPALLEAHQLTTKAARVGFDWASPAEVIEKLDEELEELQDEMQRDNSDQSALAEEMGDLLFVTVNLARKLGVEPEAALKAANRKFRRRFRHIERRLEEQGKAFANSSLAEMDGLWDEAKLFEKQSTATEQ
ncbi:MAG TPA: nucleoside triphosphate pyrophosphohydrolase [Blastocatellia bacterium]|nr:nucleoside triphosphate pyrophosphohydrolase [Blastocatellia bacterium]